MFGVMIDRWQNATRREQYLLVGVASVVMLAALAALHDMADAARVRLLTLSEQAVGSGDGIDEALWTQRAAEADAVSKVWTDASWPGASYGVLSAEIQARLMEIGAAAGLTSMVIEVDPTPLRIGSVSMLRFRLSGSALYRTSAPEFLANVAANARRLILDETSLIINPGDAGQISVAGLAPAIIVEAPARDAQPPS